MSNTWTVWGDDEGPYETGLSQEQAMRLVDKLTGEGRDDVYAENEDGDLYEGSAGTEEDQ